MGWKILSGYSRGGTVHLPGGRTLALCATHRIIDQPASAAARLNRPGSLPISHYHLSMDSQDYFNVPTPTTGDGSMRRVGCELEFAGLPLETVTETVASNLGGEVEKVSAAEYYVHARDLGAFRIELDWEFAKSQGRSRAES